MAGRARGSWLVVASLVLVMAPEAPALIVGGAGNKPLPDPGWPGGVASLINHPARIAWWEGPPFGGGQHHAEFRGDAKVLNAVLLGLAKVDAKVRRVVVHDGVGQSFWLGINPDPAKPVDASMDWVVMAWRRESWERLRTMPAGLNPTDPKDAETGPPVQVDVYAGGLVRWAEVVVPPGLEVVDERLAAHGFAESDGSVFGGKVVDLATGAPIAAKVRLQRVEPQAKGGYLYPDQSETAADASGRWALTKTPAGWYRVVVEADGYAPRDAGYAQPDGRPRWSAFDCGLARASGVSGRVVDEEGRPLEGVDVRLDDVTAGKGLGAYAAPGGYQYKTDADGRFRSGAVPAGGANVWLHKPGYIRPGLGLPIAIPSEGVTLTMCRSSSLRVSVDFRGKARPAGCMVKVDPEGGPAIGKYGAAGDVDPTNQIFLENVPPGRYVIVGRPNPSSGEDRSEPLVVELKGGQAVEVVIFAK